jgi:hypothetical protein
MSYIPQDRTLQKVKLSLRVINLAPRHVDVWGRRSIDPRILNIVMEMGGQYPYPASLLRGNLVRAWVGPRAGVNAMK